MREITPGSGKTNLVGTNKIVVFDKEGYILYGFKLLKHIVDTNTPDKLKVIRGVSPEAFVAYLEHYWPNHWSVKALKDGDGYHKLNKELLQDISEEIELFESDVREIMVHQDKYERENPE